VRVSDFDFELPADRVAQHAVARGSSRLLVLDRDGAERHRGVADLPELLRPGDLLVVNDTRVIPARLYAELAAGGGRLELLLIEKLGPRCWDALAKPGRRARPGALLRLASGLEARVVEKLGDGRHRLELSAEIEPRLAELGHVPLPPYIDRPDDDADRERYQTLFARVDGAIAAPTAGLHFSEELLAALDRRGVERVAVTLHVGIGTFKPVKVELVHEHRMERERYAIPEDTAAALERARRQGRRVVAVGTTVVRTLESAAAAGDGIRPGAGTTELFITPGYRFRTVDALITNFHLPRSTLLMLVAAFAGRERVLDAYREAVAHGYRFYSYGDAMLAERREN
jgi:S-adenosylmethionine:tRNA ribosyltransferase-isomerase